jgi:hypothetical protein
VDAAELSAQKMRPSPQHVVGIESQTPGRIFMVRGEPRS